MSRQQFEISTESKWCLSSVDGKAQPYLGGFSRQTFFRLFASGLQRSSSHRDWTWKPGIESLKVPTSKILTDSIEHFLKLLICKVVFRMWTDLAQNTVTSNMSHSRFLMISCSYFFSVSNSKVTNFRSCTSG